MRALWVFPFLVGLLFLSCSRGEQAGVRWPDGFDCGVAIILHMDSVLPRDDGTLDLSLARENIAALEALLKDFPQFEITGAFPTSEWETWPFWEDSPIQFAEFIGHSHSHQVATLKAIFGDEVAGSASGVWFANLPDSIFDADY